MNIQCSKEVLFFTDPPLSPIKTRTSTSPIPDGKLDYCGNSASSSEENDIATETANKENAILPLPLLPPMNRNLEKSKRLSDKESIKKSDGRLGKQPISLDTSSDSKGIPDFLPPTQFSPPKPRRFTKRKSSGGHTSTKALKQPAQQVTKQPKTLDHSESKGSSDESPQYTKRRKRTQSSFATGNETSAKKMTNQPNTLDPSSGKESSDELSKTVPLIRRHEITLSDTALFKSDSKDDEPFVKRQGANKSAAKNAQRKHDETLPPTQPLVALKKIDTNKTNDSYLFKSNSKNDEPVVTKKSKESKKSLRKPPKREKGGPSLISILPTQPLTEPNIDMLNDAKENEPKDSKNVPKSSSAKKSLSKQDMNRLRKKNKKGETLLHAECASHKVPIYS